MNKDRFYQILWALPIIFAIHNVEELPQLGSWANEHVTGDSFSFLRELYSFHSLTFAMILLTVVVTVVIILEYQFRNKLTFTLTMLSTCLLLINGFTHIVQSIIFQSYVPGLISAVLLLIPYMSFVLYLSLKTNRIQLKTMGLYVGISVIGMVPIIFMFLIFSKWVMG
ncbi:HXXEE domain-containing protein [Bacillus sp. FJAT-42315]|uniref:HXXEE domain-containing protein n=1 Tax=Bacillus sp. FJAT-42315 TaxID=2014077 RepID=UPI000C234B1B|nr:HXXEE domain-containing protein [Bacillus sp. FJAT-42315]